MRVTIHQPEHLPWLGFFHKMSMADTFVVLDNVQFRKNYFQNRNKIRTVAGAAWVTVPVKYEFGQRIGDVAIDNTNKRWQRKYWDSICFAYKKAPFFDAYAPALRLVLTREWCRISELNSALISKIMEFLGLKTKVVIASQLGGEGNKSSLLVSICERLGADIYVSGISGKEYLRVEDFTRAGIAVVFQEFHHPLYPQLQEPFMPCMSVIDLLFNCGAKSLDVIKGVGVPVMEEVFL